MKENTKKCKYLLVLFRENEGVISNANYQRNKVDRKLLNLQEMIEFWAPNLLPSICHFLAIKLLFFQEKIAKSKWKLSVVLLYF